jgi:hypothetical protein
VSQAASRQSHRGDQSSIQDQASPVHLGFVVDEMSLAQVFSEYFGFPLSVLFPYDPYSFIHLSLTLYKLKN